MKVILKITILFLIISCSGTEHIEVTYKENDFSRIGWKEKGGFETKFDGSIGKLAGAVVKPAVDIWKSADQFYVTKMHSVNEKVETVALEGYFRLWWTDARLAGLGDHAHPRASDALV